MKRSWYVFFIMLATLTAGDLWAQQVVFIPGGEMDGVRIGSFYLSKEEITNQDYFLFIQRDGYKKTHLWESGALQDIDRFKNGGGQFAPRSWQGANPPAGQEMQPVFGIAPQEARAYAREIGWVIPNEPMWKLARQAVPELGPYPWMETGDSISGIRLAQYNAPAALDEDRFGKLNEQIDNLRKTSAKIGNVNINSAGIRELEKNLSQVRQDLSQIQGQVQGMNERMSQEKMNRLDASLKDLAALSGGLSALAQRQDDFFGKKLPLIESRLEKLEKLEQRLQGYETLQEDQKKLKGICMDLEIRLTNLITTQENWARKIQGIEEKIGGWENKLKALEEADKGIAVVASRLTNLQAAIDELAKKDDGFQNQHIATRQSIEAIKTLANEQKTALDQITGRVAAIRQEIAAAEQKNLDAISAQIQKSAELAEKWKQSEQRIDELKTVDTGMNRQVEAMQRIDNQHQQQIMELGKNLETQGQILAKEDTSLRDVSSLLVGRCDRQDKTLEELFKQAAEIKGITDTLDDKLKRSNDVDISQTQKTDRLEQSLQQVERKTQDLDSKNVEWQKQIQAIHDANEQTRQKIFGLTREFSQGIAEQESKSKARSQEQSAGFDQKIAVLETKLDGFREQSSAALLSEVGKVQEKVNSNKGSIASLEMRVNTLGTDFGSSLQAMRENLKDFGTKQAQLQSESRDEMKKVRNSMYKIGSQITGLFRGEEGAETPTGPSVPAGVPQVLEQELRNRIVHEMQKAMKELAQGQDEVAGKLEEKLGGRMNAELQKTQQELRRDMQRELQAVEQRVAQKLSEVPLVSPGTPSPRGTVFMGGAGSGQERSTVSELCYRLAEIYHSHGFNSMSLACVKLGMELYRDRFHTDADYRQYLDESVVIPEFREEFSKAGVPLFGEPKIHVHQKGSQWLLRDSSADRVFLVELVGDRLRIDVHTLAEKFELNSEYRVNLDRADIRPRLRDEFKRAGHPLSPAPQVRVYREGEEWLIVDPGEFLKLHLGLRTERGIQIGVFHKEEICRTMRNFLDQKWAELNCPAGMGFIPAASFDPATGKGDLRLGYKWDLEFPEPQQKASVAAFYMDFHEVSRAEFAAFVESGQYRNPEHWSAEGRKHLSRLPEYQRAPAGWRRPESWEEKLPVAGVNFYEAQAYAAWKGKRLPTADEWEWAARGRDGRKFPWGDDFSEEHRNSEVSPIDRAGRDVSPFGIVGMAGNVAEWCDGEYLYQRRDLRKGFQPVRGGSFRTLWHRMQSFRQTPYAPTAAGEDLGFRCVSPIPPRD